MSTDDAIRQIESRHKLDDRWFTGGLHDSQGYVALAHKDRGELLKHVATLERLVEKLTEGTRQ